VRFLRTTLMEYVKFMGELIRSTRLSKGEGHQLPIRCDGFPNPSRFNRKKYVRWSKKGQNTPTVILQNAYINLNLGFPMKTCGILPTN